MPRCKAILLLTWLGVLMLALALMELLSLQNELFRMLFYWTYLACVPGIALLALSMLGKEVPPWRMLFMPAALICFMMPFYCWQERSLAEGLHVYACCHAVYIAVYWLAFSAITILKVLHPARTCLKWLRQLVLYLMLVPSCALIAANFCAIVKERSFAIMGRGFWILWCRFNINMMPLRYFSVLALAIVGIFCIVPLGDKTVENKLEIDDED